MGRQEREKMNKDYLGADIAKLGFGLMRLPMIKGEVDMEQTKQMADLFLKSGFTYFDTAYVYNGGKSEVAMREAVVKRHPRASFQLATKLPVWEVKSRKDMDKLFATSLERTGAGYFDFYMLHALDKGRLPSLDEHGMWEFVIRMKEKGLIRHAGFSFHDKADVLDEILTAHPEMEFVQLQINYADWESDDVQSRACYEVARKHNKAVIVMEPVKGGNLAGMPPDIQNMMRAMNPDLSVASWAVRFAASLEGVVTVLSGMSSLAQMQDNVSYMSHFKPMDDSERKVLADVVVKLAEIPVIPCTDCKYCIDSCPQKIKIPDIFSTYNDYKLYDNLAGVKGHYKWVTSKSGKASDCIACAACESHCPQHIRIIDELKEIAGVLE